jgi:hypothetical protein
MKLNRPFVEITLGAVIIVLLHILNSIHQLIFNWIIIGFRDKFLTDTHLYLQVMMLNFLTVLMISIFCTWIFIHYWKMNKFPLLQFLSLIGMLYLPFTNLLSVWTYFTLHFCQPTAYEININRLFLITCTTCFLLYSIYPIDVIVRKYSRRQILITFGIFIVYLYGYALYFGMYSRLLFQ